MINLDSKIKPMSEEEFILEDRIAKIRSVIEKYGEENFFISFSGGKDSTVLSKLCDIALPGNNMERVFVDTGMELNMIKSFVYDLAKNDPRIHIIKPSVPIIPTLEKEGYPFKSKPFSHHVERYNRIGMVDSIRSYLGETDKYGPMMRCPKRLKYIFTEEFKERLKVSDLCCKRFKEEPIANWAKEAGKSISIIGIMQEEGGRRINSKCLVFEGMKVTKFQPLTVITKKWEDWFIEKYDIDICDIYKPPMNFSRSGCRGCPFNRDIQKELDTLEKYFPDEKKACETVFKPVYEEYRRTNYRLKSEGCAEKKHGLCA